MSKNSDIFTLPSPSSELCFDKNEFMKTSFSVDEFLHQHKNAANLETMRDDLGIYLKVLRSAMIELINEDYADFVNLSANLIGLDQSINKIQKPLELLQEEVKNIQETLADTMREITEGLEEKNELRERKRNLQCQVAVDAAMIKINNLLELSEKQTKGSKTMILERMTLQAIQLNFNLKYCEHLLSDEKKMDAQKMILTLLERIKDFFLLTLKTKDITGLERCLKIYANLDECHSAEEIFKNEIISPYLNNIISEYSLQNCPQGLSGIYKQILDLFPLKMTEILKLTQNNEHLKGFNFIINSFWIEVERLLETRMSSIFAPGNPDIFYQKYKSTLEFLEKIEDFINDENILKIFRQHTQYKSFQTRWNLPVYFQIRFQEIGGSVETGCSKLIDKTIINYTNEMKLLPFYISFLSLKKCWQDGIFLPQLFSKFWKLTLQIFSRISKWIDEILLVNEWNQFDMETTKIDFFVLIYADILNLLEKSVDILNVAIEKIPIELNENIPFLETSLNETKEIFEKQLKLIEKSILKELVTMCVGHIKLVSDIPRLYRKTNKEVPSKPCAYLELILGPVKKFHHQYYQQIGHDRSVSFLLDVLSTLTVQYYSAVDDVLISVQKTEESLRRLKNLREKLPTNSTTTMNEQRAIMSDDDKIRLQLQVDIINWSTEIEKLNIPLINVTKLQELINLVEEATKIKIDEK